MEGKKGPEEEKPSKQPDLEQGAKESEPLLPKKPVKSTGGGLWGLVKSAGARLSSVALSAGTDPFALFGDDSPMTAYDPEELTNWKALTMFAGTVFTVKAIVGIIALQFGVAWCVGGIVFYFTKNPTAYSTDALSDFVKTMTISISFLIGLFLSACVQRWWDTIKSIEKLFGAVKKLTMTTINLELAPEARQALARRCVLSVLMLEAELQLKKEEGDWKEGDGTPRGGIKERQAAFWKPRLDKMQQDGQLITEERTLLERVPGFQRSFFAWSLVSQELTKQRSVLCGDGGKDLLGYDRLCELLQDGIASVSAVRTTSSFQLPFIYVHLLAFMVHLVNMLTAIGTGVTVGVLYAQAHEKNLPVDGNALGGSMVYLVVQAFLYQSFLSIGAALSFPITGTAYRIPLATMVKTLDAQLRLLNLFADEGEKASKEKGAGKERKAGVK